MTNTPPNALPLSFNQVLLAELATLRPGAFDNVEVIPRVADNAPQAIWDANAKERADNLRDLYSKVAALKDEPKRGPLAALCLSGGGIRSATFSLGVMQTMAKLGVLGGFDYVSSVSGGGYIASWLNAWMHRDGSETVLLQLGSSAGQRGANPLAPEPKQLDSLREFSNYLTPKVGLLSLDTWMLAAIVLRNVILNWLVILPLLVAAIWIPQVMPHVLKQSLDDKTVMTLITLSMVSALVSSVFAHRYRRRVFDAGRSSRQVISMTVLPLYLAAVFLAWAAAATNAHWKSVDTYSDLAAWGWASLWALVLPLAGWLVNEPIWRWRNGHAKPWHEFAGMVVSGLVATTILVGLVGWFPRWIPDHMERFVVLALPALLGTYLLARIIFVAFASLDQARAKHSVGHLEDHDREWWARYSAWILYFAIGWIVIAGACLYGPILIKATLLSPAWQATVLASVGGATGLIVRILGLGASTGSSQAATSSSPVREWILALAAPLFCASVIVLLALGTSQLVVWLYPDLPPADPLGLVALFEDLAWLIVPLLAFVLLALGFGWVVNTNYFSLHGMYRNRLVRAYLGASNSKRRADPFTGFAQNDDLALHILRTNSGSDLPARPIPVINVALNLVTTTEKLAWQQRKSESFSMTPYYCGNFHEGYRSSRDYGGDGGVSLGTAVAISGAAANPNMGYHSSPSIAFLLTLFNARLGAWLGNTNERGSESYRRDGPKSSVLPLVRELFGMSTAKSKYVNLSDGGHFENLGIYEMVLRRCRHIVVCDGGCDPKASFEDLGNAIRKIRIDFGISISFDASIEVLARESARAGSYWAVGKIHYSDADGVVDDGDLVYIKPAFYGRERPPPYDVYSYAVDSETFPHEPTSDQWFNESQFESYRALGQYIVERITAGHAVSTVSTFVAAASQTAPEVGAAAPTGSPAQPPI